MASDPIVRPMAELTTMGVGGPAEVFEPSTDAEAVELARACWASGEPWLVLGGGSNMVVADDGFPGTVLRLATRGVEPVEGAPAGRVRLRVAAGEPWDALVAFTVDRDLGGVESLSGIPGSAGAAPIQNIGAYGHECAETLVSVEFLDAATGEIETIPAADLELAYRHSAIKAGREGLVLSLVLELTDDGLSLPVQYQQLADVLGVPIGERVAVARVREAVLALRRAKGMVYDPAEPDSVGCGSFFTNPIVRASFATSLPAETPRWPVGDPEDGPVLVKVSAAWLIEHAGIHRGFALPGSRAAVSGRHTLAITNRGGATATDVAQLASFIQQRVQAEYGVVLQPEPRLVGVEL